MINKLPILGWILSIIGAWSVSVPFWLIWTHWGLGAIYFYWLPPVYQFIPFWDCVGLFVIASILKGLVPSICDITQKVETGEKEKKK